MTNDRDQLAEHLKFFAELGVDGYRKDALWAARADSRADLKVSTTYEEVSNRYEVTSNDRSADLEVGLKKPVGLEREAPAELYMPRRSG